MNSISELYFEIQKQIDRVDDSHTISQTNDEKIQQKIAALQQSSETKERLQSEFFGFGPLDPLIRNEGVTEILANAHDEIYFESQGTLHRMEDRFFTEISYRNCIHRLLEKTNSVLSLENPFCDTKFGPFRLSLVDGSVCQKETILSLRRHPGLKWNLDRLMEQGWCSVQEKEILSSVIKNQMNFLVIGSTGAGKTSVVNALLDLTSPMERSVVIEDTHEIELPNSLSLRLLTRAETSSGLPAIDQSQLVKRALRLRPDRLVMGEIRGHEAKDFVMALSTGHRGSFGTLHAKDPHQALLRLEMLIQMGAPHWSLSAIRRLLSLSLEVIIVTERTPEGKRELEGVYRLNSLEENGFLIEKLSFARGAETFFRR